MLLATPLFTKNEKLPIVVVAVPLGMLNGLNVTPFTVVLGTLDGPPRLNAPTSVPVVSTSASPLMFVGAPRTMEAA